MSSGEAELRSETKTSCELVYQRGVLVDMGVQVEILMKGDSSAAKQNASKLGPDRLKHIHTSDIFVREAIQKKLLRDIKIDGKINCSDIQTKHLLPAEWKQWRLELNTGTTVEIPIHWSIPYIRGDETDQQHQWEIPGSDEKAETKRVRSVMQRAHSAEAK